MQLTQAFEDQEVRRLLTGRDADLESAFALMDARFRKRFVKGARERLRGLPPEDLADAWQETLKDLLEALRAGRFNADRELGPWLWTIFIRRASDGARRRRREAGMVERAKDAVETSSVGDILEEIDEEERSRLLAQVLAAVEGLPPRQRTVLRAFVDHFPATQDREVLLREVSNLTGRDETPSGMRRALQEARRKIGGVLRTRLA